MTRYVSEEDQNMDEQLNALALAALEAIRKHIEETKEERRK